jgi:hypothetical protein
MTLNRNRSEPLLTLLVVFVGLVQLGFLIGGTRGGLLGGVDFRHLYTAGYMVRTGHGPEIYDFPASAAYQERLVGTGGLNLPFNHFAYEALLFLPLSYLSYKSAYLVFMGVNFALIFLSVRATWPPAAWIADASRMLPLLLFGFLPFGHALIEGQDSILMLTVVAYTFVLLSRNRDLAAGLVLGLAMFKFQFVIPIAVLVGLQRRWRFSAGFAFSAALMVAMSVGVVGIEGLRTYASYLASMSAHLNSTADSMRFGVWPHIMANVRGMVFVGLHNWVTPRTLQIVTAVCSIALFLWAVRKKLVFELIVIVAVLLSYHAIEHDLVLLLVPLLKFAPTPDTETKLYLPAWMAVVASPAIFFLLKIAQSVIGVELLFLLFAMTRSAKQSGWRRISRRRGLSP